jgi:hypothetical protein
MIATDKSVVVFAQGIGEKAWDTVADGIPAA